MSKYRVLRAHQGDRFYNVGDVREGDDLAHLVPGVLEPIEEVRRRRVRKRKPEEVQPEQAKLTEPLEPAKPLSVVAQGLAISLIGAPDPTSEEE